MKKHSAFPKFLLAIIAVTVLFTSEARSGYDNRQAASVNIHRHRNVGYFVPKLYENPTTISFSNGITFDTRAGEPALTDEFQIEQYDGIGYYLVQVTGPMLRSWKQEISASGGRISGYIPNYTLIVRADEKAILKIREKSFVRWTGIFQPAYKLSEPLFSATGIAKIIIQIFPSEDIYAVSRKVSNYGFSVDDVTDHVLVKRLVATGNLSVLPKIARIPEVLWIQRWSRPETCNNNIQWVVQTGWQSSVPGPEGWRIWNEGILGEGLVLSTTDSGIRTDHVVYYDASQPITEPGVYPNHKKIVAYKLNQGADFGDDPNNSFHGTHVNCTVAGDDSINGGINPFDGIARHSRLYFVDLGDINGNLHINSITTMCDTIYLGRELPYNILQHSGSWGWYNSVGTYLIHDAELDAYVWAHRDFLNLYAAGNEDTFRRIRNPGIAKNTLTIGATGNGTIANSIAAFSSRGPTQDGRIKPTIMAPGLFIISADGATTNQYSLKSGTSMATPAANGAIGLIRQYLLAGFYPSGSANPADSIRYQSAALLRTLAIVSADPNIGSYTVPDSNIGWGRIDVDSVVYFDGDARKLLILDDTIGINTGEAVTDSFTVVSQIPLRVCVAWTDTAAAPNANPTLVNDLNIELTAPDGTTYRGNQYSGGQSIPNPTDWDNVNVEECCRIDNPQIGPWLITVSGQQVVFGPQPYAYAITGDIEPGVGVEEGDEDNKQINNFRPNCRLVNSVTRGAITLEISLPRADNLEINIHDRSGRKVGNIFAGKVPSGKKVIKHYSDLPCGIYFVKFKTKEYYQIKKLLIIR